MKIYLLFCFFLFHASLSVCQTYEVLYVKGQIKLKEKDILLKKNTRYKKNTDLVFTSPAAGMIVLDIVKKRNYLVKPYRKGNKLLPAYRLLKSRSGTRPGKISSGIEMVKYLNEGENYLVTGEETYIPIAVGNSGYKMNQDTFLYLQYNYKGLDIAKKLRLNENGLLIHKDSTFRVSVTQAEYYRVLMRDSRTKLNAPDKDTIITVDPRDLTVEKNSFINNKDGKTTDYYTNMRLIYRDVKNKENLFFEAPKPPNLSSPLKRSYLPFNIIFLEDGDLFSVLNIIKETDLFSKEDGIEYMMNFIEEEYGGRLDKVDFLRWWERSR